MKQILQKTKDNIYRFSYGTDGLVGTLMLHCRSSRTVTLPRPEERERGLGTRLTVTWHKLTSIWSSPKQHSVEAGDPFLCIVHWSCLKEEYGIIRHLDAKLLASLLAVCLHVASCAETDDPLWHGPFLKLLLGCIVLKHFLTSITGTENKPEILETFSLLRWKGEGHVERAHTVVCIHVLIKHQIKTTKHDWNSIPQTP